VPRSLHRTWAALAVASLAVLCIALLAGRDFVRDVYPECAGSLEAKPLNMDAEKLRSLVPVALDGTSSFQLLFDKTESPIAHGFGPRYSNVRIVWTQADRNGEPCTCGSIPALLFGEAPSELGLYRVAGTDEYAVANTDVRAVFIVKPGAARHLQSDRVFTRHQLPALVALLALGALGVALLRSRLAMAYALRMHAWTEARLTPEGRVEADGGATLGTLEQSQSTRLRPGPVLVAPSALSSAGLYRDMPIIERRSIAEGTHARWAGATMMRLRDARTLAVISTLCTMLAFGARLMA
jgi:hypothetical protein